MSVVIRRGMMMLLLSYDLLVHSLSLALLILVAVPGRGRGKGASTRRGSRVIKIECTGYKTRWRRGSGYWIEKGVVDVVVRLVLGRGPKS